jgi:hypothetical protein
VRVSENEANNVVPLVSAPTLTPEERSAREAWSCAVAEAAAAKPAVELSREARELADLINMADALLYVTEKSCDEFLKKIPPEVEESMFHLRRAIALRNPGGLRFSLARLERQTRELFFDPDAPIK